MALRKCPSCGKEISTSAKKCVHCGVEIANNKSFLDDEETKRVISLLRSISNVCIVLWPILGLILCVAEQFALGVILIFSTIIIYAFFAYLILTLKHLCEINLKLNR